MEPYYKLSRQQKTQLITRYLKGCWKFFAVGIVCACLGMALNALAENRSTAPRRELL